MVSSDDASLHDLFARAAIQVGVGPTAPYEGLAFGLDTYLLDLPTVQWMSPIIDSGEATLVESAAELATHITDTSPARPVRKVLSAGCGRERRGTLDRLLAEGTVVLAHRR